MALTFTTNEPDELLKKIIEAIDNKQVVTWEYDSDGDFTHTPDQWYKKAYLRPVIGLGVLKFGIITSKGSTLSKPEYAVYHGRFIEMVTTHLDNKFDEVKATALGASPDKFNW